ncbi:hypothetical protein BHE74_00047315 [Ensete ventricosum]|nr:hypothetical protein BHE74_00047315 [Ensete ventricosum]
MLITGLLLVVSFGPFTFAPCSDQRNPLVTLHLRQQSICTPTTASKCIRESTQETTTFSCYVSDVVRFQPLSTDPPMPFSEAESASKAEKVMQEEEEEERERAEVVLPIRALDSFGLFNTGGERTSSSSAASVMFSIFDIVECRSPMSDPLRFSLRRPVLPSIKKPPIKLPPIYLRQRWGEISGPESSYVPRFYSSGGERERLRVRSYLYMEWNKPM